MSELPPNLKVTLDRLNDIQASIKQLGSMRVMAGVPSEKTERTFELGDEKPDITNAELAYIHDNGAPEANIPAREFLRPAIQPIMGKLSAMFKKAAEAAFSGDQNRLFTILTYIGFEAQSAIRAKIIDGPFEPLAEATIAARRRKGFKGTLPLNVTGQLRNAQTYVIRQEGKGDIVGET